MLAPLDMKTDRVGNALAELTDKDYASLPNPPVAGDGETPIGSRAPTGSRSATASIWVRQPNVERFVLELNQMEPPLRARMPDACRRP